MTTHEGIHVPASVNSPNSGFRAIAEPAGDGWRVTVVGAPGSAEIHAHVLAEADNRARRLIFGYTGRHDTELEVVIPEATRYRLHLVAQLYEDAALEIDAARSELASAGLSALDIDWLVRKVWP